MIGRLPLLLNVCVAGFLCLAPCGAFTARSAVAADLPAKYAPEIRGVLKNSELVFDRLKMLFDLTNASEKEQYPIVKDFIDVFLIGVDPTKPIRMDLLTAAETTQYRMFVPVNSFPDFWKENLDPLGIPVRSYPAVPGLFKLGGGESDAFEGFMRWAADVRGGYAAIAEEVEAIPANMPEPIAGVKDLLATEALLAMRLQNPDEGVKERFTHFEQEKQAALSKLTRDSNETAADFQLRKYMAEFQFDEMQLFYAETKDLLIPFHFDPSAQSATLSLDFLPIPGTSLADSVAAFGKVTSRFAGVPRGAEDQTSGRILLPLDDFHQKHIQELLKRAGEQQRALIAANDQKSADQKAALVKIVDGAFERISEGVASGLFDGFIEMAHAQDAPSTVVGGLRAVDGAKWIPVLEQIPQAYPDATFKPNTSEYNGLNLHTVTLSKQEHSDFFEIFGDGTLIVGTGPDAIFYAAGPNAEAKLKAAIDAAAKPGESSMQAISFRGRLRWWLQLFDSRLGETGFSSYRKLALEAFRESEGRIQVELGRSGDRVTGETTIDAGMLRLLGKGLAEFSKENLN